MKRRKPLPRSTVPIKRSGVKPRRGPPRRFAKRRCQPYLDWLKTQPCCITGKRTGELLRDETATGGVIKDWFFRIHVDPAHVRPRGAGHDDLYNAVPLSRHLHDEQNSWNCGIKTWQKRYNVDLLALAKSYTERFLATQEEKQ